jgi:hypothetical protein
LRHPERSNVVLNLGGKVEPEVLLPWNAMQLKKENVDPGQTHASYTQVPCFPRSRLRISLLLTRKSFRPVSRNWEGLTPGLYVMQWWWNFRRPLAVKRNSGHLMMYHLLKLYNAKLLLKRQWIVDEKICERKRPWSVFEVLSQHSRLSIYPVPNRNHTGRLSLYYADMPG